MTALLEEAFQQTQTLPDDAQDWLAALLLENLRDARQWDAQFAASPDVLEELFDEADADYRAGTHHPTECLTPEPCMRSHLTTAFRKAYRALPADARRDAQKAYRLWQKTPFHSSLQFKEIVITKTKSLWSVRTELDYRALGTRPEPDLIVWHWIGTHAEYDGLVTARRTRKRQTSG